jgi:hypothetical protein
VESDSESEGAFAMHFDSDSDAPELESVTDSTDDDDGFDNPDLEEGDWFSEIGDDEYRDDEDLEGADETGSVFVAESNPGNIPIRAEVYDSGCTKHISPYQDDLENFTEIPPRPFRAANKQSFSATGIGEMTVDIPNGVDVSKLQLTEVLYSLEVGYTLVSIGNLDDEGFTATFGGGKCVITGPDGKRVGEIPKNHRGLYRVERSSETAEVAVEEITLDQLHRRMGHISPETAQKLVQKGFVTGVRLETTASGDPFFCESCTYAKSTRKPIQKVRGGERATVFGGEVHSDVWGPAPVETKGGRRYYITYTDDCTRLTHLYLLRKKDEVPETYKQYEAWAKTQLDAAIKILHSDRGGEYLGKGFILHLKSKGTEQKLTVHDTPQHNGVAERRNRTIVERICALLHAGGLPRSLWGEAARHVVWLMNRTPTKAVHGKTPYEAAFGKKPDLSEVREWGEKVWVRIEGGDKLGGRVKEGRWMGVSEDSKGVRVYWPDKRTVSTERNVYYDKTSMSVSRLEGEEWDGFVETKPDIPSSINQTPSLPDNPTAVESPPDNPKPIETTPEAEESQSEVESLEIRPKRTREPTQRVRDLLSGQAVTSNLPRGPKIAA